MFKKRRVPTGDTVRPVAAEELQSVTQNEDSDETLVKRTKPEKKLDSDSVVTETKSDEAIKELPLIIVDGSELEELEEKRRNTAVVEVDKTAIPKKTSKFGPSSAPAYMRATTIVDYKPDLCKDYNETGYCGYGDSCIYLHDRTTYVSGNVLDQRWDEMLKKKNSIQTSDPSRVPPPNDASTCAICNSVMRSPMVKTRCGHKFCKTCALERYDKGSLTCASCGLQTMGIFNEVR